MRASPRTAEAHPPPPAPARLPRGVVPARPEGRGWLAQLVLTLAVSDLRLRYGRGPLRLLKWLLDPFAIVGVYLILVAIVLRRHGPAPGLSLACAVVPFQLIMATFSNAVWAVQARRAMIANMSFPITLVPLVATVTESMAFASSLSLFVLMMAIYGVAPTFALALLPVIVAATFALALSVAYLVSLVGIWAPELTAFLQSFARALFFLAPGLISLDQVHGEAHTLLELNPLTALFESYRDVFLFGRVPVAWHLLVPMAVGILLLTLLVPPYRREQHHFPKVLE